MKPLFDYQERMIEKIVRTGRQAAFLNMGLGKTRSTLEALRQMKAFPALVVAPVRVAKTVWKEEAAKWGTGLEVVPLVGTGGERKKALAAGADIFTISYENLVWLMEEVDCDARFRAVVWDELSKMKHPGTRRFKLMRHRMMEIPVRIGLTGTPQGNRLEDLWGEMFAVAGAEPLGPSKVQFLMQYFHAIPMGEHAKRWDPNPGAQELIHERIKPWAFSLDASKAPPLPEVKVNVIEPSPPAPPVPLRVRPPLLAEAKPAPAGALLPPAPPPRRWAGTSWSATGTRTRPPWSTYPMGSPSPPRAPSSAPGPLPRKARAAGWARPPTSWARPLARWRATPCTGATPCGCRWTAARSIWTWTTGCT